MFVRVAHVAALGAASLVLCTSAAASQAPASAQEQPSKSKASGSQNERYCETITMIGSRIAKKKFCGTRAEWADRKLQDRQAVDRIQTMPCMPDSRTRTGRPSC